MRSAAAKSLLSRIDSNSARLFASQVREGTLSALKKLRSSCHFQREMSFYGWRSRVSFPAPGQQGKVRTYTRSMPWIRRSITSDEE